MQRFSQGIISFALILFTGVLTCCSYKLQAQLNPDKLVQFSEKDGLPGSEVYDILPDKNGYIWIGTINGLSRFDGYEFKRYFNNPNDSNSIRGSIIYALYQDAKENIWVTGVANINRYDPVTKIFHHYEYDHLVDHVGLSETGVTTVNADANGRIYFGVRVNRGEPITHGLLYYDEKIDSVKRVEYPDSLEIGEVFQSSLDILGNFWFLSRTGLFSINSSGKLSRFHGLDGAIDTSRVYVAGLYADKNGQLWIGTSNKLLYRINLQTGEKKLYSLQELFPGGQMDMRFNSMETGPDSTLWIGSSLGLICLHQKNGKFDSFNSESDRKLEREGLRVMHFDDFGNIWMGSFTKGLLKYDNTNLLKSYSSRAGDKNSISAGWANKITEIDNGKILVTTAAQDGVGGFNEIDLETGQINSIQNEIRFFGWGISTFWEYKPGEFWISTFGGNYTFWPATKKREKLELPGIPDNLNVWTFYRDRYQNLWIGSTIGVYLKTKEDTMFRQFKLSDIEGSNQTSDDAVAFLESPLYGLWVRTNNGLFLYNYKEGKFERHGFDKKKGDVFFSQDVNALYEDPDGILWVGTWAGGLGRYDVKNRKIKNYTTNDGLPSMSVQSILGDEDNGILWMGSFDGLIKFDKKTGESYSFSIADGIQSQLFADGAACKTSKGYFIFGGSNGITIFKPDEIAKSSIPPKVFLTDFKIFNKSIQPGESSILKKPIGQTKDITLSYNQNNITIDFLGIHFGNPQRNRYAVKLENFESDWRDLGGQRTAYYSNLPPGKYVFHLKAANNNGVWTEQGVALNIIILPPWWKTLWAYAAYLIGFLLLLFAADRYFRRRLLQKEKQRNQARELEQAREIEIAYKQLSVAHETLINTQNQLVQSEKMASLGVLTAGIAHEIQNPLNFVNNFAEVNVELLGEMKTEMNSGKTTEVEEIAGLLQINNTKIRDHGKRADAIVKSMLQHSRAGSGKKESTDINALCDEYLKLSYHGYRAKQNGFTAEIQTVFGNNLPKVNIIPQDIGRVFMNLFNNAFMSMEQKQHLSGDGYTPKIIVRTIKNGPVIEILIEDNGMGISDSIRGKVFQPFFTTRPTGQGTGLGLSLSYDIMKAHDGKITVESKEGEGAVFILQLPA